MSALSLCLVLWKYYFNSRTLACHNSFQIIIFLATQGKHLDRKSTPGAVQAWLKLTSRYLELLSLDQKCLHLLLLLWEAAHCCKVLCIQAHCGVIHLIKYQSINHQSIHPSIDQTSKGSIGTLSKIFCTDVHKRGRGLSSSLKMVVSSLHTVVTKIGLTHR